MTPRESSDQPDLLQRGAAPATKSIEDLSQELEEQQERLLQLKRQQQEVERRKRELEELNKRRAELAEGQKFLRERFTRAITVLERADYEARREIEQLQIIRSTFSQQLADIDAIQPAHWPPESIDEELTKALSKIDHAHTIYNESRAKIDALSGRDIEDGSRTEAAAADQEDAETGLPFGELVRRGFGLTLPLILVLSALGLILLIKF